MVGIVTLGSNGQYDWAKDVKKFDDTKAGVKGLVDAGVATIPRFFIHPAATLPSTTPLPPPETLHLDLPTVDFRGVKIGCGERRREVVAAIREAASEWGFFRIVNHGVPIDIMEGMLEGVRRFHEQPKEKKMELYSGDSRRVIRFNSNAPQNESEAACWRDLLTCVFSDDSLDPQVIPLACRKEVEEYVKHMIQMRETMSELLSEALGLSSDYLSSIECMKSEALACLYYPPCPEPHLTLGTVKHSDTTFLTLLLQDHVGGLQILHRGQWINIPPSPGAFIVNIGDLLQMISNDKFISVEHRVLAQRVGPRVSVACFFTPSSKAVAKPFGPIKELLSDENPPLYREFLCGEYYQYYKSKGQGATSALPHYRL